MSRGRRKIENPATARRILAAAERVFAAEGMAGARTDEIAAAAHANKAMLYYYFGNKRRLHRAVLENLLRQLHSRSALSPEKGRPRARKAARVRRRLFRFSGDASELSAPGAARGHGSEPEFRMDRAPVSAAVSQPIGAHHRGRDRGGGISAGGSRSHGAEHSGDDHVLFRRRAYLERNRGARSAGAEVGRGAEAGAA